MDKQTVIVVLTGVALGLALGTVPRLGDMVRSFTGDTEPRFDRAALDRATRDHALPPRACAR